MAKIYPQFITENERRNNRGRRAEYYVYDLLSRELGDNWLVLYGKAIKWEHKYGVSDRENDFLIAHPDLGILALEVKGGSISYENGRWYTTWLSELNKPLNERNKFLLGKSPFEQVTGAAKAYERKIREYIKHQRLDTWNFSIATAVCFPDVEINKNQYLASDTIPELTLDRKDLCNLKDRISKILKLYQKNSYNEPPGEKGIEILKNVFARDWNLPSFLLYQMENAEDTRKFLTEQQFQVLYNLQDNTKMLISGCAGSGKTLIAARKAQILAQQGHKVLFTCYNSNLAEWLCRSDFAHTNILMTNFHKFCSSEIKRANSINIKYKNEVGISQDKYFSDYLPEMLELAAIENESVFDAIVVDEGQDFQSHWLKILMNLLDNRDEGIFYIFYDDNQRIYNKETIPFNWPSYKFTRNMRNTNPIFEEVRKYYYQPENISSSGIDGPEPWIFDKITNYKAKLEEIIHQVEQEKVSLSDIEILTPLSKENSIWGKQLRNLGKYQLVWKLNPIHNQISVSTIHGFKGLEKPVIILTEIERIKPSNYDELLYIASSRAKDHLIVISQ